MQPAVCIMASMRNGTIYTGVTFLHTKLCYPRYTL